MTVWTVRAPRGARDVLTAKIINKPERFDRVDRVKAVAGETILPGDDRFWILGDPLVVEVGDDRIEIPVGFTTDGASVPVWAQRLTRWKPWDIRSAGRGSCTTGSTRSPGSASVTRTTRSAPYSRQRVLVGCDAS